MATMAPCLRGDLRIVERSFRGDTSYVVKDLATQKYFRFGKTEISVMRRLDGRHTPREIAAGLAAEGIRISADVVERFARKLAAGGLLERTLAERSTLQIERLREQRRKRQRAPLFRGELLRMRWSFGDPDALLEQVMPGIRWMFTPAFVALSVALFVAYAVALGANWEAFRAALSDTYAPFHLTMARVITLWITAAAVILIHELGHAFSCKHFGGEVRELGFMILFFQPAFYCNVNDAWSFPTRRARLWVTASGAWIELIVTVAATFVWLIVRPQTLVADVVIAIMFIGGVTTILGNMNPLLPLDGYFALADWLEIANLRHRALAHLSWWTKRRVLRLDIPEPPASPRERRVFLIYGAMASAYIAALFAVLSLLALGWVGRAAGGLGVAAGLLALFLALRPRIMAWARFAALSLRARRGALRGWWRPMTLGVIALLVVGLLVPWTLTSVGPFSLHPAASFTVVAPDSGVVAQVLVTEGSRVAAGAPLVRLVDRALERELLVAARGVDSTATAAIAARAGAHAADAERLVADHQAAVAALTALERRWAQLTLRALASGVVVTARPEELMGRRVAPGEALLVVASLDSLEARVSIGGAGATRVRAGQVVHLVSYSDVTSPWTSRVDNVASAGTTTNDLEARVTRAADSHWRAGVTGEAKIEIARSSALGALWWKARQLVRGDFWL